ncbi:unnamed protein product [Ilex paraguariensis]|uniref:Uncharacterized protein n=1 Tax=Ilex paraguariensis TaxID=185542 RepID=A0ABC8TE63_9AQUA
MELESSLRKLGLKNCLMESNPHSAVADVFGIYIQSNLVNTVAQTINKEISVQLSSNFVTFPTRSGTADTVNNINIRSNAVIVTLLLLRRQLVAVVTIIATTLSLSEAIR